MRGLILELNWRLIGLLFAVVLSGGVGYSLANHTRPVEIVMFDTSGRIDDTPLLLELGAGYGSAPRPVEADMQIYITPDWDTLDPINKALCEPYCTGDGAADVIQFIARSTIFRGRGYMFVRYGGLGDGQTVPECLTPALAHLIRGEENAAAGVCGLAPGAWVIERQETLTF